MDGKDGINPFEARVSELDGLRVSFSGGLSSTSISGPGLGLTISSTPSFLFVRSSSSYEGPANPFSKLCG